MIRELNIALIGCGSWGKNIARNLYQMGSLACIYDKDIKLSEKLSNEYSLPTLELTKIFKDRNINAVVFSTPAITHKDIAVEALKNDNQWKSDKFNKKYDAYKRLIVKRFPKYLIIHLKRFSYNRYGSKKSYSIDFSEKIQLKNNKYELRGMIKHMGSVGGGHYISIIKKDGEWFTFNDNIVSKTNIDQYINNSYIYLYSRIK